MLRTMAEPLGEVCSVTRRLLRRGLGLHTSRRVNVFFSAKGPILFEQPSYTVVWTTDSISKYITDKESNSCLLRLSDIKPCSSLVR